MKILKGTLAGLVLLSQTGFALPGQNFLEELAETRAARVNPAPSEVRNCVNFTGKWAGKCSASGHSEDSNLEIVQKDCQSIQFGHEVSAIGSLDTRSQALP